jgi:hypothetical protein
MQPHFGNFRECPEVHNSHQGKYSEVSSCHQAILLKTLPGHFERNGDLQQLLARIVGQLVTAYARFSDSALGGL